MSLGELGTWSGAQYVRAFGDRHTAAAFAQYRGYGEMTARDEQGTEMGTFSAKDLIAGIGYGYVLSDNWAGGANLKVVHESLGEFSAAALAVDVGLNYYNENEELQWTQRVCTSQSPIGCVERTAPCASTISCYPHGFDTLEQIGLYPSRREATEHGSPSH